MTQVATTKASKETTWTIAFTEAAFKDMKRLDRSIQKRIYRYLSEKVAYLDDPRQFGKSLKYGAKGIWRYRIADTYRILCDIQDKQLLVLVLEVGHRRRIYH